MYCQLFMKYPHKTKHDIDHLGHWPSGTLKLDFGESELILFADRPENLDQLIDHAQQLRMKLALVTKPEERRDDSAEAADRIEDQHGAGEGPRGQADRGGDDVPVPHTAERPADHRPG